MILLLLLIAIPLLATGFQGSVYGLKVTNGFPFHVKVYYGYYYKNHVTYYSDAVAIVTHTSSTRTTTSTLGVLFPPIELDAGQTGELRYTGNPFACNDKGNYSFFAEDSKGNIIYRKTLTSQDIKVLDSKLTISASTSE